MTDGLAEERRLARFRLDHEDVQRGDGDLQRDCRRPAPGANVEQARVQAKLRPVTLAVDAVEVARRDERLDEQPVDGFVRGVLQREGREIDLFVPKLEQAVVGAQGLSGLRVQRDVRFPGPLRQPLAELPWRHG